MRAFIYIRVSTLEQAREGYSIKSQEERLRDYAKARGYTVVKVYSDPGFSGSNLNRPGLQEMITQVKKGYADVVLVYKLDRLSRSQKDTLYLIEEIFLKNDISFISMSESFDTSSSFGRAMIGILSVFAQLEREQIKERVLMGKEARAKSGKWHGGGGVNRLAVGYDYKDGELVINEYEAECVRFIYNEYLKGNGITKVYLKVIEKFPGILSSETTVRNIIKNPLYIGKIKYKDNVYEGIHKAIIAENQFNTAQELLKKRTTSSFKKLYLISGIAYCGHCGARMFGRTGGKYKDGSSAKYYSCYSRYGHRPHMVTDLNCQKKNERQDKIDNIVINEISKLNIDYVDEYRFKNTDTVDKVNSLEKKRKDIDKQLSKMIDLYSIDNSPIELITEKIEKLKSDRDKITNHINELEDENEDEKLQEIKRTVSQLSDFDWDNEETQKKRLIAATLINKVIISNDKVTIEWAF
ncbi:recombinase family protein [Gracilibacillus dipsosauri]|uniref:recombinase family protein n=1 Tax=Gracilibacillus dipsosauri TaxID=178340 RepID=UPI00240A6AF8